MKKIVLPLLIFSLAFIAPAFAQETKVLIGQEYFQATQRAIQEAKESIYLAMYLINVEPVPTDNPASILLEDLISAKKRGVYVKVVLDNGKFSMNYLAYKRLREAGVDVYLDSSRVVLHGKGIVIDSKICILGSFNWSRASLNDNYEFATYIEDPQQAKKLLEYISQIPLGPRPPIQPQQQPGLKLPVSLITATPKPLLFGVFTSQAGEAFDLYLYLVKKAQTGNSNVITIDYYECADAIGYNKKDRVDIYRVFRKLDKKYALIQYPAGSKDITLITMPSSSYITIPDTYWDYGFYKKLSLAAKYMYLIALYESQCSPRNPYWFRSYEDLSRKYYICEGSITNGINELEKENILEIYRSRPEKRGKFSDRLANNYRLNPLQSPEQFQQSLNVLSEKYGPDITRKSCELSAQLNEPKDIEKIETYIELIRTYGYEKVGEVNSLVASKRREAGFRDISQVILLLKGMVK